MAACVRGSYDQPRHHHAGECRCAAHCRNKFEPAEDALATSVKVADDPKVPRMPRSAYLTFVHNMRPTMQGSVIEIAACLRKLWTEMDPIEKQALEEKAKAEIEQYHKDSLIVIQGKSSKYKGDFNLQLHEQQQSIRANMPECCRCSH